MMDNIIRFGNMKIELIPNFNDGQFKLRTTIKTEKPELYAVQIDDTKSLTHLHYFEAMRKLEDYIRKHD